MEHSVELARPVAAVHRALLSDDDWLPALAQAAEREGGQHLAPVGPGAGAAGGSAGPCVPDRRLRVDLAGWRCRGPSLVVSLRWDHEDRPGRHVLDADLELAPLDDDRCRLVLSASYLPPLCGAAEADWAARHGAAQATAASFLRGLAETVQQLPG